MKKKYGFGKVSLMGVVLLLLFATLPAVASADSKVRFNSTVPLAIVGALDIDAEFDTNKKGEIKKVTIKTTSELVSGVVAVASCLPSDDFCTDLTGASLTSVHNSKVDLKKPSELPGVAFVGIDPVFGLFPTVLVGDIKGELEGNVTVVSPTGAMDGEMKLKIRRNEDPAVSALPTSIYGCIVSFAIPAPAPGGISDCVAGAGTLVPLFLNIQDTGKLEIKSGSGDFADVDKVEAKVVVTILGGSGVAVLDGKIEYDD